VVVPPLVGRATAGQLRLAGVYSISGISGGWGGVHVDRSQLAGLIEVNGLVELEGCKLNDPDLQIGGNLYIRGGTLEITTNPILLAGDAIMIESCNIVDLNAVTFAEAPGVLRVDGMVDYLLTASGGCTLTNGTKTVME